MGVNHAMSTIIQVRAIARPSRVGCAVRASVASRAGVVEAAADGVGPGVPGLHSVACVRLCKPFDCCVYSYQPVTISDRSAREAEPGPHCMTTGPAAGHPVGAAACSTLVTPPSHACPTANMIASTPIA